MLCKCDGDIVARVQSFEAQERLAINMIDIDIDGGME